MDIIKIRDVKTPERGTPLSAGLDFFIPNDIDWYRDCAGDFTAVEYTKEDKCARLHPGESITIPAGIVVRVPQGKALVFFNKSGVASKKRLQVGACVIDEDYQGEVHINLHNVGLATVYLQRNEKIVQGLLLNVSYDEVKECSSKTELFPETSERGTGGFGSTNK